VLGTSAADGALASSVGAGSVGASRLAGGGAELTAAGLPGAADDVVPDPAVEGWFAVALAVRSELVVEPVAGAVGPDEQAASMRMMASDWAIHAELRRCSPRLCTVSPWHAGAAHGAWVPARG